MFQWLKLCQLDVDCTECVQNNGNRNIATLVFHGTMNLGLCRRRYHFTQHHDVCAWNILDFLIHRVHHSLSSAIFIFDFNSLAFAWRHVVLLISNSTSQKVPTMWIFPACTLNLHIWCWKIICINHFCLPNHISKGQIQGIIVSCPTRSRQEHCTNQCHLHMVDQDLNLWWHSTEINTG